MTTTAAPAKTAMASDPDVITPWIAYKRSLYTKRPCTSNRASQIGGDCERELAYWRTRWEDATIPDVATQILLQEGEKHEREVLLELQRAGVQVIEQQASLEMRELAVTGHIDATIVHEGESIPVDVKSMSAHIFDSLFRSGSGTYQWKDVAAGFDRRPWLRKYPAQITLYALMKNCPRGMLLCLNKGTGALAQVIVDLDYDYAESLLRRAERINGHVESGTLPVRIAYDEKVCPRCPFFSTCLPQFQGRDPIAFLADDTVEEILEERAAHERAARTFRKADDRLKTWAKAREEDRVSVGRWLVVKRKMARGVRVDVREVTQSTA